MMGSMKTFVTDGRTDGLTEAILKDQPIKIIKSTNALVYLSLIEDQFPIVLF